MKKIIISIVIAVVGLVFTLSYFYVKSAEEYEQEVHDSYLTKTTASAIELNKINVVNEKYIAVSEKETLMTLSFLGLPGEDMFNDDSISFDDDLLSFYKSKYIDLSYDPEIVYVSNELSMLIALESSNGEEFYITADAIFNVPSADEYTGVYSLTLDITLDSIHFYIMDKNYDTLIDIATLTAEGTVVVNDYIMLSDYFLIHKNTGHKAFLKVNKDETSTDTGLTCDVDLTYSLVMLPNGQLRYVQETDPVLNACDSMYVDLFDLEEISIEEIVKGYYYDSTGLTKINNAEYPDFNSEFSQTTPLNDLYNSRYADWDSWTDFSSWDDKLIFECSFINNMNVERHFFLQITLDLNSAEKDSNYSYLYELIDGEYVQITDETLNLEGYKMTGLEETYVCNSDNLLWYEELASIGERDLPSYLFSLIFKEIE